MKKLFLGMFTLAVLFVLPACSWVPVSVAPSNTPLEGRTYTKLERISVSDKKVRLLGFIPLSGNNRLEDTVEKAKKQSGGDALVDIIVEYHYSWYIIFSSRSNHLTATPIRFTNAERTASSSSNLNLHVTSTSPYAKTDATPALPSSKTVETQGTH